MEKEFVTYEIALALKELGFNCKCIGMYGPKFSLLGVGMNWNTKNLNDINEEYCSAPLWQQAIDWLREEHNIYLTIYNPLLYNSYYPDSKYGFDCEIEFLTKNDNVASTLISNNDSGFETCYDAREKGVLKAIEIIKENKL